MATAINQNEIETLQKQIEELKEAIASIRGWIESQPRLDDGTIERIERINVDGILHLSNRVEALEAGAKAFAGRLGKVEPIAVDVPKIDQRLKKVEPIAVDVPKIDQRLKTLEEPEVALKAAAAARLKEFQAAKDDAALADAIKKEPDADVLVEIARNLKLDTPAQARILDVMARTVDGKVMARLITNAGAAVAAGA